MRTAPVTFRSILAAAIRDSRVYLRGAKMMPTRAASRSCAAFACLSMDVPYGSRIADCERAYVRATLRNQDAYRSYA